MPSILLNNARVLLGDVPQLEGPLNVLVRDDRIER
jgi:hypothetical protein